MSREGHGERERERRDLLCVRRRAREERAERRESREEREPISKSKKKSAPRRGLLSVLFSPPIILGLGLRPVDYSGRFILTFYSPTYYQFLWLSSIIHLLPSSIHITDILLNATITPLSDSTLRKCVCICWGFTCTSNAMHHCLTAMYRALRTVCEAMHGV